EVECLSLALPCGAVKLAGTPGCIAGFSALFDAKAPSAPAPLTLRLWRCFGEAVGLGSQWGAYAVAINTLWGGFDVALGWLWARLPAFSAFCILHSAFVLSWLWAAFQGTSFSRAEPRFCPRTLDFGL